MQDRRDKVKIANERRLDDRIRETKRYDLCRIWYFTHGVHQKLLTESKESFGILLPSSQEKVRGELRLSRTTSSVTRNAMEKSCQRHPPFARVKQEPATVGMFTWTEEGLIE